MVYDSTAEAYRDLMDALPALFKSYHAAEEYLTDRMLTAMEQQCRDTFFCGEMVPPYEQRDVINILKYYAQYETAPQFYTFDEIDRSRLDVEQIAQHIWDEDMGERRRAEYVNSIWDAGDDNMLRLFFGRKLYFLRQLDIECMKISHPGIYEDEQNVKYGTRQLEDLPFYEIGQVNPKREKEFSGHLIWLKICNALEREFAYNTLRLAQFQNKLSLPMTGNNPEKNGDGNCIL